MSNKHYVFTEKDRKKGLTVRCRSNCEEAKKKKQYARARRIKLGLQLKTVAELLGITTVAVTNKEAGKQQFTVNEAIKLINLYRIDTLEDFIKIFKK